MGVKIISRKYNNQFYSSGNFTDWLIGNVGDWQRLELTFEAFVDYKASPAESISVNEVDKTLQLNNGKAWNFYGFDIGDVCTFDYILIEDADNDGTFTETPYSASFTILNLYGNIIEYSGTLDFHDFNIIPTDRGNIKITNVKIETDKAPQGMKFRYSHITNDNYQSKTLSSFIDGTVTEFSYAGLNLLGTGQSGFLNPDGLQSGMAIDTCTVEKVAGTVPTFKINCDFMFASIFEDISNLETKTAPSILYNAGSLTDNFEIVVYPEWNNPNTVISNDLEHTARLGNTGWFNENFNGLDNNFVLESIKYRDISGNPLSQLDYSRPVVLEVEISGIQNLTNDTEFGLGFAWIPVNEVDYKSKRTPYHNNLYINTGRKFIEGSFNLNENTGTIVYQGNTNNDARMDVMAEGNVMFVKVSANKARMKVRFMPNADFVSTFNAKNENDRNYLIWVSVANHSLPINFSDRVSIAVDYNHMVKVIPPAGPINGMTNTFVEHPYADNAIGNPFLFGHIEDDILNRVIFKIDKRLMKLHDITFGVEIFNKETKQSYVLENITENLALFPPDANGVQQISIDKSRGFKLVSGNNKNFVRMSRETSLDDGIHVGYKCYFATKIRWEDWIIRNGVPLEFFNGSLPNNGYHNNWLDYQRNGVDYVLNFFVQVTTIENNVFKTHKNVFPFQVNGYDENLNIQTQHTYYRDSDNTVLNIGTDPDTGKPLGVILSNEPTRIEIIYTNLATDFDFAKTYCVISIEEYNGAGEVNYRQLSSIWLSEEDNPLKPMSGEDNLKLESIAPNVIKSSCIIEPSLLNKVSKFKITGRIGCFDSSQNTGGLDGIYEQQYIETYE